jgi:hypothetical protein
MMLAPCRCDGVNVAKITHEICQRPRKITDAIPCGGEFGFGLLGASNKLIPSTRSRTHSPESAMLRLVVPTVSVNPGEKIAQVNLGILQLRDALGLGLQGVDSLDQATAISRCRNRRRVSFRETAQRNQIVSHS